MTNRCYTCGGRKPEMFNVTFRKLGIQPRHNVRVGYSEYLCSDCLKNFGLYQEIFQ